MLMKKLTQILLAILICISSFTWEIIQNILGVFATLFCFLCTFGNKNYEVKWYKGEILVFGNFSCTGVNLGRFIILDYHYKQQVYFGKNMIQFTIDHEWGHSRQSLMLGPLYLLVVGIPSAIHKLYNRTLYKDEPNSLKRAILKDKEYYNWYCEKWADKLGGVDRSEIYNKID